MTDLYAAVPPQQAEAIRQFRIDHPLRQVNLGGNAWSYIDTGSGTETVLILVGGLRVADAGFKATRELEGDYRVVVPGYPALDTMTALADGVAGVLDAAGVDRAHVLAGSFGGMLAQVFARRHPDRITRLVLSSTGVPDAGRYRQQARLTALTPAPLVRRLTQQRLLKIMDPPADQRAFWAAYLKELFTRRLGKTDILSTFACIIDFAENHRPPADGSAIWDGPVLIIGAEDDATFDAAARAALAQAFPQAQTHTFAAAGHSPSMSQRGDYFRLVRAFLAGESPAAG